MSQQAKDESRTPKQDKAKDRPMPLCIGNRLKGSTTNKVPDK